MLCYISGFDLRRISADTTPFLKDALSAFPWIEFTNLPSNELFPTLVTGVDPTQHQVWGVKLEASTATSTVFVDLLPDFLTTTFQGILHLVTGTFDLAAVPPRRRRRFDITRTKYRRRQGQLEALFKIGDVSTLFDVVGASCSRYVFDSGYEPVRKLLPRLCEPDSILEVVELYSLDRMQQWNLDQPHKVLDFYTRIDEFLSHLHERCQRSGKLLMIVSDHGHEPIRQSIDLNAELARLALPRDDFTHFVEVSSARFWFHSDGAREAVTAMLSSLERGTLVPYTAMKDYGVPLQDSQYGEVFYFLDPGLIFFPHDFHQPLANLWLGLTDRMQRSRLRDPRHKGNHGHLPAFEIERSFLALLDPGFEPRVDHCNILDVAPTILEVLGFDQPATMTGRPVFSPMVRH